MDETISNMNLLVKHFNDAPALEYPTHLSFSDIQMDYLNNLESVYGGKYILNKLYIENIPINKRSVWCCDVNRTNFLIKTDVAWVVDKNATILMKKTINPVINMLEKYSIRKNTKLLQDGNISNESLNESAHLITVIKEMNDKKIQQKIARKACGDFCMNKIEMLDFIDKLQ